MISSVFSLKESNMVPDYLKPNKETVLEQNYFSSSLDYLTECNEELLLFKQSFYRTMLEEENPYVLNEAYENVKATLKKIIKKVVAYIETLVKRFTTSIAKFISSDKYILSMEEDIKKFPSDKKFTINGYEYTFNRDIPAVDIVGLDVEEIENILKSSKNSTIIYSNLSNIFNRLTDDTTMNKIRSKILNVSYPVAETAYGNELFSIYRDNKSATDDIIIDRDTIIKSLEDYKQYKTKFKDLEDFKYKIKTKYESIEKQIDSITKKSKDINGDDKETSEALNNLISNTISSFINQVQRISNLHVQAIAAKMDAYVECIKQEREILFKALNHVHKDIDNTFAMGESNVDYLRDLEYREYVVEKYFMNKNHQRFVEECLALSENNIPELKTIHEDLKMDVKNKYEKFKELIKQLFEKFRNKITSFFNKDKQFLADNKDAILNKQVPEYTLNNMPQYSLGIKNLQNSNLPVFADIDKLVSMSEEEVKKAVLPEYDGSKEFNEFATRFFLCNNTESKDIPSSNKDEVNMQEIYNFCSSDKILNSIQNDITKYNNEVSRVQSKILNSVSESSVYHEGASNYLYSMVLEQFINEEDATDTKETTKPEITPNKQQSSDQSKDGAKIDTKVDSNDDKTKENPKTTDTEEKKEAPKTNTKLAETGDWYLKYLRVAIGAKMNAYQTIYTEYMKIIRYHISVVNGEKTDGGDINKDEEVKKSLKDYLKADKDSKESAADKVIALFKKFGRTIDRHDVDTIANKNAAKLDK